MNESQTPSDFSRKSTAKTAIYLSLAVLVMLLVFSCVQLEERSQLRFKTQIATIDRELPELIRKFRSATATDSGTSLIWSGEGAQVIEQEFEVRKTKVSGDQARWHLTLKTASGRFFDLRFELLKQDNCEIAADCLTVDYFVPRTTQEIKARIVRSGNARLYQELFNEPMPAREIPA